VLRRGIASYRTFEKLLEEQGDDGGKEMGAREATGGRDERVFTPSPCKFTEARVSRANSNFSHRVLERVLAFVSEKSATEEATKQTSANLLSQSVRL